MNHAAAVMPHPGYGDCHSRLRRVGDIQLVAQPDVCPMASGKRAQLWLAVGERY
jgi:hypothetical protein